MSDNVDKLVRLTLSLPWNKTEIAEIKRILNVFSLWAGLFHYCVKEKICGSFYYTCLEHDLLPLFPEKYQENLKKEYVSITAHNLVQLDNLDKVLRLFEDNNLPVLIIKGYSLLTYVYPSLGARYPLDIDLVVRNKDLAGSKKLLGSAGYKSLPLYPDILGKKGFLPIDLKTDFIGLDRIRSRAFTACLPLEDIFTRSIEWKNGYVFSKIPSWEDHILILCSHAEKHSYSKLSFFYDISRILIERSNEIDLERLKTRAFKSNVQKPLFFSLKYTQKRLYYPIENKLLDELENSINLSSVERGILRHVLSGKKLHAAGALLPIFSIKGLRKKARFVWESAFPKEEVLRQVTGIRKPGLRWIMYPARMIQLVGETVKFLFGLKP